MKVIKFLMIFLITIVSAYHHVPADEAPLDGSLIKQVAASRKKDEKRNLAFRWKIAGQSAAIADFGDDGASPASGIPTGENLEFGIKKVSLMAMGRLTEFAELKLHLLSIPMTSTRAVGVVDLHLILKFHHLLYFKMGRFKKTFTKTYTPFWFEWRFFDAPVDFKYAKGKLGLGGRGEGIAFYGATRFKSLKYFAGVFNGLEEAKPWKKGDIAFQRSDDFVQTVGRLDWKPLSVLGLGGGLTYLPGTSLQSSRSDPEDPGQVIVNSSDRNLLAYSTSATLNLAGLSLEAEYIGHASVIDGAENVLGGGFHADALYDIPMPMGKLQPGIRYFRQYANFDSDDSYSHGLTGAFNWLIKKQLRIGFELGHFMYEPAGNRSTQVLAQTAFTI